jgi:hypothetical protein
MNSSATAKEDRAKDTKVDRAKEDRYRYTFTLMYLATVMTQWTFLLSFVYAWFTIYVLGFHVDAEPTDHPWRNFITRVCFVWFHECLIATIVLKHHPEIMHVPSFDKKFQQASQKWGWKL